jgi:hypothetical protein
LGRNAVPGLGSVQADLSLARRFVFTEQLNLQFRADAFNVLNHPNFANPSGTVLLSSSGVLAFTNGGVATQMLSQGLGGLNALYQVGGPRSIQLSLKLQF